MLLSATYTGHVLKFVSESQSQSLFILGRYLPVKRDFQMGVCVCGGGGGDKT